MMSSKFVFRASLVGIAMVVAGCGGSAKTTGMGGRGGTGSSGGAAGGVTGAPRGGAGGTDGGRDGAAGQGGRDASTDGAAATGEVGAGGGGWASGGASSFGGQSEGTGGSSAVGGAAGGRTGTGGLASGGANGSGGAFARGGASGGTGGAWAGGGTLGTGGGLASGGASGTGGVFATGGASGTGGVFATGGASGTGGVFATGGAVGTGGVFASGGASGTGGVFATGGVVGTGGLASGGVGGGSGGLSASGGASGSGGRGGSIGTGTTTIAWDFASTTEEWVGEFCDYPPNSGTGYDLAYRWSSLPAEVGPGGGLLISGSNHSDDLFMYIKRRLTGLVPGAQYVLDVSVTLDTNAPATCGGIGGSPGESVFVKIGSVPFEPLASLDASERLILNLDKGNQSVGGADMKVVGNISNTLPCSDRIYQSKTLNLVGFSARTASDGSLWIVIGTDSGFEGITTLYYDRIAVTLTPSR